MHVGVFHNRYVFRGGEDAVVDLEVELLRKAGHEVHLFSVDSAEIRSWRDGLRAGLAARWNAAMAKRVAAFLEEHPVQLGHVHNFFPLLSPAVHAALKQRGLPVVQTLHNYRLYCANGLFLREARPCEDCVARGPWNAIRHGCYRGSRLQTLAWARATAYQRSPRFWHELVDRFVTPSEFARCKLVAAGLPSELVVVKPNPVADPGEPSSGGHGAVYVGRLSAEKGGRLLLEAWRRLGGYPLCIVGTGPEEAALRSLAADLPTVRLTGQLPPEGVREELARAAFAVAPSLCYENSPLSVVEAMAAGRPVVAPRSTALGEMLDDGRTGWLFRVGDARELAEACRRLVADPARAQQMGRDARSDYEDRFTPERSLERLVALYDEVLESA